MVQTLPSQAKIELVEEGWQSGSDFQTSYGHYFVFSCPSSGKGEN